VAAGLLESVKVMWARAPRSCGSTTDSSRASAHILFLLLGFVQLLGQVILQSHLADGVELPF
jgi:hypothetical protein